MALLGLDSEVSKWPSIAISEGKGSSVDSYRHLCLIQEGLGEGSSAKDNLPATRQGEIRSRLFLGFYVLCTHQVIKPETQGWSKMDPEKIALINPHYFQWLHFE